MLRHIKDRHCDVERVGYDKHRDKGFEYPLKEHEFAQNKDNGIGADSSETSKTDKDGFMEAPDGEIPFD